MKTSIEINAEIYQLDLSHPLDISLTISNSEQNPIAWYLDQPIIEPVKSGDWIGKVSEGKSSTNFNNIYFNPHGHGTHTECLGHITHDFYSINDCLKTFFFDATLISIKPNQVNDDFVIEKYQIEHLLKKNQSKALIIRTLPNNSNKKNLKYSHTNPPYLSQSATTYIKECGIEHLLIDLPSVDKEKDDGKLFSHKAFWNVTDIKNLNPDARKNSTITELIFVDDAILDGYYLLNLQIASFENDASPSKPILYKLEKVKKS